MKKIFFLLFLLVSLTALAQNNDDADTTAKPAITEKGKPDGEKTEMNMDKDGGTLVSSDGKLELIIPPGALSKKTNISIQPVTNLMPNGNGKAYSLEPSGIRFQQPAQLIFHYSPEEAEDTMQLLMGIATQDDKGQWYRLRDITLDTITKTITGNIPHFSTWTSFEKLEIDPSNKRLKVNKELLLTIQIIEDENENESQEPVTDEIRVFRKAQIKWNAIWSANGINNGNNNEGRISKVNKTNAMYKAPATVPDRNPVEVAAKLQGLIQKITYKLKKNGPDITTTFKDLRLVSNISIYDDQYEVKMTVINYNGLVAYGALNVDLIDSGSFIVSMEGKRTRVVDIKNYLYKFTNYSDLKIEYLNKETCTGPLNITGVKELRVTKADPPKQPYSIVQILFIQSKIVLPEFKVKDKVVALPELAAKFMAMVPAWPIFIKFVAKEGEQKILDENDNGYHLLFTVKRLEEE